MTQQFANTPDTTEPRPALQGVMTWLGRLTHQQTAHNTPAEPQDLDQLVREMGEWAAV